LDRRPPPPRADDPDEGPGQRRRPVTVLVADGEPGLESQATGRPRARSFR